MGSLASVVSLALLGADLKIDRDAPQFSNSQPNGDNAVEMWALDVMPLVSSLPPDKFSASVSVKIESVRSQKLGSLEAELKFDNDKLSRLSPETFDVELVDTSSTELLWTPESVALTSTLGMAIASVFRTLSSISWSATILVLDAITGRAALDFGNGSLLGSVG